MNHVSSRDVSAAQAVLSHTFLSLPPSFLCPMSSPVALFPAPSPAAIAPPLHSAFCLPSASPLLHPLPLPDGCHWWCLLARYWHVEHPLID